MSFTAVGGDTHRLQATWWGGPADTHHQGTIRVKGPTDRQGVHILWEQGLMGECVADASIVLYLKGRDKMLQKDGAVERTGRESEKSNRAKKGARARKEGENQ